MNSAKSILSLFVILSFAIQACTPGKVSNSPYRYEYTPREAAALDEVKQAPVRFLVPFAEDSYAWERAQYFFIDTLKAGKPTITTGSTNGDIYLSGRSKGYSYSIRKSPAAGGYSYQVACVVIGSNAVNRESDLNARNLSRFVKQGTLEKNAITY